MLVNAKKNPVKGFSLVELSVVIAVIGILATLTIPQLQKWVLRAKRAEVKGNLTNLYAGEVSVKNQFGFYVTQFSCLGVEPQGRLRYRFGFGTSMAFAVPPELVTCMFQLLPPWRRGHNTINFCVGLDINCIEEPEATSAGFIPAIFEVSIPQSIGFTAHGRADLDRNGVDFDTWQINNTKNLSLISDEID